MRNDRVFPVISAVPIVSLEGHWDGDLLIGTNSGVLMNLAHILGSMSLAEVALSAGVAHETGRSNDSARKLRRLTTEVSERSEQA